MANNLIPFPTSFHSKSDENVRNHVERFKIYAQLKEIQADLAAIKIHFGQFLQSTAFTWWIHHKDDQFANVQDFYDLFISTFLREPPPHISTSELRSRKYTDNDTPQSYTDDILKLCQNAHIHDEERQIFHLLFGLPDTCRAIISAINPQTVSDAYQKVCSFKTSLDDHFTPAKQQLAASDSKIDSMQQIIKDMDGSKCYSHRSTKVAAGISSIRWQAYF